jgi:transcriptional regulator with XRE-family HTH domain
MSQPENPVFSPEYECLRAVIVETRQSAGLSQLEVARRIGRNSTHVTLLERGQRRIEFLEFYRLVHAMERDPAVVAARVFEAFDGLAPRTDLEGTS